MCLKTNCFYIECIEIRDNVKVVLHYDRQDKPILIQYWDETKRPNLQLLFEPTPEIPAPKVFEPINRTLIFEPR
jgi:hypothetical protein